MADFTKCHQDFYSRETLEEAGYVYFAYDNGSYILRNLKTNTYEVFYTNKYCAGWALLWKNTALEFGYSLPNKTFKKSI